MVKILRLILLSLIVACTIGTHAASDSLRKNESLLAGAIEKPKSLSLDVNLAQSIGDGSFAPFWFTSNRQGFSVVDNVGTVLWAGLRGNHRFNDNWQINYGARVGTTDYLFTDDINLHWVPIYYVDAGYRWLTLSVGAKERWDETVNPRLSSGGLTWSGNALPMPQVRIEVPEFQRLNLLGRWFSIRGHIAYGRFMDDRYRRERHEYAREGSEWSDGLLYHSKAGFLKFGDKTRFPLEVTVGLEMYAQFGGTAYNNPRFNINGPYKLPSGIAAYTEVLIPFNPLGEQGSENGNNLGSWHLSFDYYLDKWKLRAYYEHFYEDHSSMLGIEYKNNRHGEKEFVFYGFRRNWMDGLFGLELNAPEGLPFSNIVLEFMNTRGQCGPNCNFWYELAPEGVDGRDNMYNHGIYQSYTHSGFAIGNPVLISPLYTDSNGSIKFTGNRVQMFHLGVDGNITPSIGYRVLATHSRHWGTYDAPFSEVEKITSILAELSYRMKQNKSWLFTLSYGQDRDSGSRVGSKAGGMITVNKTIDLL